MPVHLGAKARRQKFVASFVLPERLGRDLRVRYPSLESIAIAKRGLRQWLRLHVVAPELPAPPSVAVYVLWREFVRGADYNRFAKRAYGHLLSRGPDRKLLGRRAPPSTSAEMALTFAMACADEDVDAHHPMRLPVLFSVDDSLQLSDGQHWALNCGHDACATKAGRRCVFHELRPLIPRRLPKQIRFGLPAP